MYMSTNTFKPGHLYCAAFYETDADGESWTRYEGFYWRGGDGRWYREDVSEDGGLDVAHPWFDVMVEQAGCFNPEIAALVAEVAA